MAVLPIVLGADAPVLRGKTKKVPKVTKAILQLLKDMIETTVHAQGAGIAAPQVNRTERVCIVMLQRKKLVALINPEIVWKSEEMDMMEEGCLSLPNVWVNVARHLEIQVKFMDVDGKKHELKLKGWDARVVQHEVDHLDGILITDRVKEQSMPPALAL